MVVRLLILLLVVAAIVGYVLHRFVFRPMWQRTLDACQERDRVLAEREEALRQEEEDRRRAERELESLLHSPDEHVDVANGIRGKE